jgi:predicted methyltransferase
MAQRASASLVGVRTTRVKSLLTPGRRRFTRLWATAITPRGHVRGYTALSVQRFPLRYHDGGGVTGRPLASTI